MHEQYAQYREKPSCIATKIWIIKGWNMKMKKKIRKMNSILHKLQHKDFRDTRWRTMIYRYLWIKNLLFMIPFSYFSAKADFFDYLDYSITLIIYLNKIKRQISGNLSFSGENGWNQFPFIRPISYKTHFNSSWNHMRSVWTIH